MLSNRAIIPGQQQIWRRTISEVNHN